MNLPDWYIKTEFIGQRKNGTSISVTYGPHKAVAEVSNHNEPIGRKSGIQLVRKSNGLHIQLFCFEPTNWLAN